MNTLIATFYGYKGGTGRTLALSNVARYLADELGYRIGLIDLDLESPGLVHEPLSAELEPESERRQALLGEIDNQKGFIDCYLDRVIAADSRPSPISEYVFPLGNGKRGGILLVTAAEGSVFKTGVYHSRMSRFVAALSPKTAGNLDEGAQTSAYVNLASEVTWTILRDFAEEYQLDFLLVDGRTGVGAVFSPVYMYAIPHLMVMFCGLNEQNVQGSIATLQTTDPSASDEVPVIFVLSPVPTVGPGELEERLRFVAARLTQARSERKIGVKYRYKLPNRVDHLLPYSDAATYGEIYFPGRYPNSILAHAHRKLARGIASLVVRPEEEERRSEPRISNTVVEPVRVAFERIHADILKSSRLEMKPEPWISENVDSPWEVLRRLKRGEPTTQLVEQLPDIIVLPQTHLQALAGMAGGDLLYSLNDLRKYADGNHRAVDFEFLDTHYLNWRHWCSDERSLAGLPFSVNAMLLCCNTSQLRGICELYWKEKGRVPDDPFFMPSSWSAVTALLEAGLKQGQTRDAMFRMVGGNRGFYYDWLNYIASMGGFDLIQSEGRMTQIVALGRRETIDATKGFLRLARLCGRADNMEALITAFARREVAMYVGWTDSFRFDRKGGLLSTISVAASGERAEIVGDMPQHIRLGYVPRDMRYSRNTLVDGWLMTFPIKADKSRLARALAFASKFLDPNEQRILLRGGFPSPSAWVVEQELDALHSERLVSGRDPATIGDISSAQERANQSFEVFLETMKLAIHSGKWISSPKTIDPIENSVARILKMPRHDEEGIADQLRDLAGEIKIQVETKARI